MSRRREWSQSDFSLVDGSQVGSRQFHAGKSKIGALRVLKFWAFAIRSACRFGRQDRAASGTLQEHISFGTRVTILRKEPTGWWAKVFTDYLALTKKRRDTSFITAIVWEPDTLDGGTLLIGLEVAETTQVSSLAILCWESFDSKPNCHMLNEFFI